MIDGDGALAIGAAVMIGTEIAKTLLPADKATRLAPYVALALSLVATVAFVASMPTLPGRTEIFGLLVAWLQVFGTATGVYHAAKIAKAVAA